MGNSRIIAYLERSKRPVSAAWKKIEARPLTDSRDLENENYGINYNCLLERLWRRGERHPIGSRRQAMIAGKYGGVFCNLPDGTVCMCNYSYQHEDSDFLVGDTVILVVQRYAEEKKQMYGKILSKW